MKAKLIFDNRNVHPVYLLSRFTATSFVPQDLRTKGNKQCSYLNLSLEICNFGNVVNESSYQGVQSSLLKKHGNVGIGTTTPQQKLHVNGGIATANGGVKRDFLRWSTTSSSPGKVHIKTNIRDKSYVMYRILVEGYNYGNGEPIFSDATGYTYGGWDCIPNGPPNQRNTNYAPGVSISQYCSSDGFLVIKLTTPSTYYMGFTVSGWFVNPTGNDFDISANVYHQDADL